MASGIESVSLALAILPLVANQLDNYVRGIERLKGFRRWRLQLGDYARALGVRRALLLNALELSLVGVVDDHDERAELISDPIGPRWKHPKFQVSFAQKFGRNEKIFNAVVHDLSQMLQELSTRLGIDAGDPSVTNPPNWRKFRKIFSTAVYDDLLDKIDRTIDILNTLSEHATQRELSRRGPSKRRALQEHRNQRHHAKELYGILIQDRQSWQCSCQDKHSVCFRLGIATRAPDKKWPNDTKFNMLLSSTPNSTSSQKYWHEVEVEAHYESEPPQNEPSHSCPKPSTVRLTQRLERTHKEPPQPLGSTINGLCMRLGNLQQSNDTSRPSSSASLPCPKFLGYLATPDGSITQHRYYMGLRRTILGEIRFQSLQDTLIGTSSVPNRPVKDPDELDRGDRLYLATVLACSILQLHGTWLHRHWGTGDILFVRFSEASSPLYSHPFLLKNPSEVMSTSHYNPDDVAFTRGENSNVVLLPLALALIELSLGKPITSLTAEEDRDSNGVILYTKTAVRLLPKVHRESGLRYGDAVKECLFWSRSNGETFEDSQFEESVFSSIVDPLLKDLEYFKGVIIR